mgnify:CR=1 FL=1
MNFIKYLIILILLILIAGDRSNRILFSETLGLDPSVLDEIFEKLDDLDWLKLFNEKKERSIKNLWGLLDDISCI